MMEHSTPLDETRLFRGPGTLAVYVPPEPPPQPDDYKRDFPPGFPPEVHYQGITANYWVVLREGQMPLMNRTKVFNEKQMSWLRSIESQVEAILLY